MGFQSSLTILDRIKTVPADSPIAVFLVKRRGCLECCFANTAKARHRIDVMHDPLLIGEFTSRDHANGCADRLITMAVNESGAAAMERAARVKWSRQAHV